MDFDTLPKVRRWGDAVNPSYYAIIPANVRYCEDIPPNAKLLYGELTALAQKEGYAWPSNGHLAKLYSVNPTTVSEWLRKLQAMGFIRIEVLPEKGNERRIWIAGGIPEIPKGSSGKAEHPSSGKAEHNNTRLNNKSNNTSVASSERPSEPPPPHKNKDVRNSDIALRDSQTTQLLAVFPQSPNTMPNIARKVVMAKLKTVPFETLMEATRQYARWRAEEGKPEFNRGAQKWYGADMYENPVPVLQKVPIDGNNQKRGPMSSAEIRAAEDALERQNA